MMTMSPFTALAEPNRRRLLDALLLGPQPVGKLVQGLGMSQPVVSKHLRILRDLGLVEVQPDGQRRLYSLNTKPLQEIDNWLEPYRRFLAARLDALEQHLEDQSQ
jgi:DNA-binding transcriptional ArsR family regulator